MFSEDLLLALREAYASASQMEVSEIGLCGLHVLSYGESNWDRFYSDRTICEVDFPPLEDVEKEKLFLGIWWNSEFDYLPRPGDGVVVRQGEAATNFLKLADRLGASLPLEIRSSIEGNQKLPACAVWCLLLYQDHATRHGTDGYCRAWGEPFWGSLQLAERLQMDAGAGRSQGGRKIATGEIRELIVIEDFERNTPPLNRESVEWIAARKENQKKLGLPVETLRNYRTASKGGRKMPDEMFGVDRDERRWRRQGTSKSMVYYFVPSLPKR